MLDSHCFYVSLFFFKLKREKYKNPPSHLNAGYDLMAGSKLFIQLHKFHKMLLHMKRLSFHVNPTICRANRSYDHGSFFKTPPISVRTSFHHTTTPCTHQWRRGRWRTCKTFGDHALDPYLLVIGGVIAVYLCTRNCRHWRRPNYHLVVLYSNPVSCPLVLQLTSEL